MIQVRDLIKHKLIRVPAPEKELQLKHGQHILLKNKREKVVAEVTQTQREIPNVKVEEDYLFDRILTDAEFAEYQALQADEAERVKIAQTEVQNLGLNMRIFASRIGWKQEVYSFLFVSPSTVDFRDLLKTITKKFPGRIHLQRVDSRDRAEIMGGIGPCGREDCCAFLRLKNERVSLDAVRDQGIMIKNNDKLYGPSGKIKGCMLYEVSLYKEYRKYLPHIRQEVTVSGRKGRVTGVDILNGTVKVFFIETEGLEVLQVEEVEWPNKREFPREEVKITIPELTEEVVGF